MKKLLCSLVMVSMVVMSGWAMAADTIKIGAIFSVTGPASFLGAPEAKTLEMLTEELNAKGRFEFDKDFVLKTALVCVGQGAKYDVSKLRDKKTLEAIKESFADYRDVKGIQIPFTAVVRRDDSLMLERTLTQFMSNALGVSLRRHAQLDHAIKALALLLVSFGIVIYLALRFE